MPGSAFSSSAEAVLRSRSPLFFSSALVSALAGAVAGALFLAWAQASGALRRPPAITATASRVTSRLSMCVLLAAARYGARVRLSSTACRLSCQRECSRADRASRGRRGGYPPRGGCDPRPRARGLAHRDRVRARGQCPVRARRPAHLRGQGSSARQSPHRPPRRGRPARGRGRGREHEAAGVPIAAPSANRSGRPSPTRAGHVRDDLDGRVELILDGGPTPVGVESTVLDMTGEFPLLLRPGGVPLEALREALGPVRVVAGADHEAAGRSPGLRYRHYAPRAEVILVDPGAGEAAVQPWLEAGRPVALVSQRPIALERPRLTVRVMPADLQAYARDLFALLRELDTAGVEVIVVEAVPETGLGRTNMDRLRRASA